MKIGIDLDGVIFDSEKDFRIYSELYDVIELKRNSIKDNRELKFQDRYNWNKEEVQNFLKRYHKQIVSECNFMPGAKNVLKLLKQEGHELIIITARGGLDKSIIALTKDRLKEHNMEIFDKYYWVTENKDEVCKQEKIDIMIDDYNKKCESIANSKIKTIYLKDAPSYELQENEYIKVRYNWGEIYREITRLNREEK